MPDIKNRIATGLNAAMRRWGRDRRGNFAIIFAVAIIPILVAIGAAIDLSQAYLVKQRLSRALDAAGLAVGTTTGMTNEQILAIAQAYFDANYPAAKLGVPGTLSLSQSGQIVSLSVHATMPTSIMGVVGINTLNVSASSQITKMGKKLEVVLVLDTTGSMSSSNKLSTLKTAAKNLIATVSASAVTPGDVKVSIVPFAVDVNVGTASKTANWIKWTWTTPKTQTCSGWGWDRVCTDKSYTISPSTWKGCVIDRDQDYDISNSLPVTSPVTAATLYPADNDDCKPVPLMPLSHDWTALNNKIDNLVASGNTNTTIGLVWGWNMLTAGGVLSNAAAPATNLNKVIVFLTDGENTENRFSSSQSSIDARTKALCTAIKANNIQIYTIRVIEGNATLLRNCATSADMYYSVSTASELTSVFASIAQALSNLRISQ